VSSWALPELDDWCDAIDRAVLQVRSAGIRTALTMPATDSHACGRCPGSVPVRSDISTLRAGWAGGTVVTRC
jgi:hypothetical protein